MVSSQGGQTWTEHGRLPDGGDPTVLTAVTAPRLLVADSTNAVYEPTDAGRTWTVLQRPSTNGPP
ncbi:hypothetical protein ABT009_41515 [Streptomyces sp. NPDC002896]|uniref:hypothetical protein n=1 Tax=Streptomyces sp. NPDC002896 TaxID=3154438 RepID=UPI00332437F1